MQRCDVAMLRRCDVATFCTTMEKVLGQAKRQSRAEWFFFHAAVTLFRIC